MYFRVPGSISKNLDVPQSTLKYIKIPWLDRLHTCSLCKVIKNQPHHCHSWLCRHTIQRFKDIQLPKLVFHGTATVQKSFALSNGHWSIHLFLFWPFSPIWDILIITQDILQNLLLCLSPSTFKISPSTGRNIWIGSSSPPWKHSLMPEWQKPA